MMNKQNQQPQTPRPPQPRRNRPKTTDKTNGKKTGKQKKTHGEKPKQSILCDDFAPFRRITNYSFIISAVHYMLENSIYPAQMWSPSTSFIYLRVKEIPRRMVCICLLYTSPSPRDLSTSRMPSSA